MDFHRILLFFLVWIVNFYNALRSCAHLTRKLKDLFVHRLWIFMNKILPKRRFALAKIPRHVALSIADYDMEEEAEKPNEISDRLVNFDDLAKLIFWCARCGVEKISVYDWKGVVAGSEGTRILAERVLRHFDDLNALYEEADVRLFVNGSAFTKQPKFDRVNGKNGHSDESRTQNVHLVTLDWTSGKRGVVDAARSLKTCPNSAQDASKNINEFLAKNHHVTPPDLLIEFGGSKVGDSTCGYPPLALRVAEIERLAGHRGVDEVTFFECLDRFSQRDRRFGK